jgi:polysaccharide chain length determinant protein (PEP-CTERM system associated)
MLPGKKYTPEDILLILRRRYWMVLIPLAVISATSVAVARRLPNWYRSEALVLVVPQRVPENYVKSAINSRIEDRLQAISQQILSRTRLERVIQDFDLYREERRSGIMEDIVEKMRTREVQIQVVKGDAFTVSYIGRDPRTVMLVTDRLASLFIEENLKDREQLADGTNDFLETQLEDARRRLIEQEKKLEVYRRQHAGELPSQLDSNLQAIQNTQMQVQAVVESLNRDRDRRLVLERQLSEVPDAPVDSGAGRAAGDSAVAGSPAQQLEAARAQLKSMEMRLKPEHPDIGIMKRRVRDLEQAAEAVALATPVTEGPSRAELARQQRIDSLKQEIAHIDRSIAQKTEEERRLRSISSSYQGRVDAAPARETELVELTRDYTGLQGMYSSLLQKKEDSKLAANLERRQIGEQFKMLDPARMPERPFSPNRQLYYLGGLAAGLTIGLGLIALLEYRDRSFRSDQDVTRILALPVLAVVPAMQSDDEKQRTFRRRVAANVAFGSTVAVCLAVVAYAFLR